MYNIGLIYGNTGKYTQALDHQALSLNKSSTNNIAVIYHSQALRASLEEDEYIELSKLFDKAAEY
jgi:hypothetical protein